MFTFLIKCSGEFFKTCFEQHKFHILSVLTPIDFNYTTVLPIRNTEGKTDYKCHQHTYEYSYTYVP